MLVFFKNIPPTTKKEDLLKFIKPAMKRRNLFHRIFSLPGAIVDITLLTLMDKENNVVNADSIVTIVPDDLAALIIEQLNREVVNGRRITVREYHIRSEQNDPRKCASEASQDIVDQRKEERRQYELVPF